MTALTESRAHFEQRMVEVGMSEICRRSVLAKGITTMSILAFSHGQPGVPIAEAEFHVFANNTLGAMMSMADEASLKRLLFESQTMILSQFKEAVANPEAASTRKLPQVEREARMQRLKQRLVGVLIEGQLEPAHALLDLTAQQWESRQLAYLEPARCVSREYEIAMGKNVKQVHLDVDKFVGKDKAEVPHQHGMTELQTYEAFRRRSLAYVAADIMSWAPQERYVAKLYQRLRREPPAGFAKPTIQQVLRADRAVFTKLIQDNVSVRRDPVTNDLPLDAALHEALSDYDVAFHLIPLPKAAQPAAPDRKPPVNNQTWNTRSGPYQPPKGKGKSKSKTSKGKSSFAPKPFQGRDCVSSDPHQRRLCYDYNLNKCQKAPDGGECQHGHHLCMRRHCQAPHPECEHDKLTAKP